MMWLKWPPLFTCSKADKPSWRAVVIAMASRGVGKNPAAAEDVAKMCNESEF